MQHARDIWGWAVVPADSRTKRPLVPWAPFQRRLPTDAELARWAEAPGWAVVTGRLSGVVVVDLDPGFPDDLRPSAPALTVCTRTPRGGWHLFYEHPGHLRLPTRAGVRPAVDLRADGGIAVLPTPGQADRQWVCSPDEVALAPIPPWVAALTTGAPSTTATKTTSTPAGNPGEAGIPGAPVRNIFRTGAPDWRFNPRTDPLTAWSLDAQLLVGALQVLGIPQQAADGRPFRCVLPGHDDAHPSASLFRMPDGTLVYRDWHRATGGSGWVPLPIVRASRAYRHVPQLPAPTVAVWTLRLVVEAGMPPAPVPGQFAPADARPAVQRLGRAIQLLFGCRWLRSPGEPTPLALRFISPWADLSVRHANDALDVLIQRGIVTAVAKLGVLDLYLPGPGALAACRGGSQ